MAALDSLPRDVEFVQNIFFTLPLPFSLTLANHNTYWPLVDNVYSLKNSRDVTARDSDTEIHTPAYISRQALCRYKLTRDSVPTSSQRASIAKRVAVSCNVSFRVLFFENYIEYHISQKQGY
jgi:hypothetical protein